MKDASNTPRLAVTLLAVLALAKLVLHLAVNLVGGHGYGYFLDEFYYIACSRHLDWAYVDHPGLSIWLLAANGALFGDGLFALRLLPAVAGAGVVFLAGALAREFGGGTRAQALAALAMLVAPIALVVDSFYSMNAFEPLFWTAAALVLVRLVRTGNTRLWMLFGLLAGLGAQNKFGMVFFAGAVLAGLLLAGRWTFLADRFFWIGAAIGVAVALPILLWQLGHDWATLEFMNNARTLKNESGSLGDFFFAQLLFQNPLAAPLWLLGIAGALLHPRLRLCRFLAPAYALLFAFFWLQGGKSYYLTPIYPALLAAGAVIAEGWLARRTWNWPYRTVLVLLVAGGALLAPIGLPLLSPPDFLAYQAMLGIEQPHMERGMEPLLPQYFADRIGWEAFVRDVGRAFRTLSPEERRRAVVYTETYADAGAVDLFGPAVGLPPAISGHNTYWLWGLRGRSGEVVIAVGGDAEDYEDAYSSVHLALVHDGGPYVMPRRQHLPIWVLGAPKHSLGSVWHSTKGYR